MSKDFLKKYRKTNSKFHSKAKFKLPLLKKIQTTEKDFGRARMPKWALLSNAHWADFAKDIFPLMAFQNSEFKAF